jgi:hypothetical protein
MARTTKVSRIRIAGELLEASDAKRDVTLHRTLADVWHGKRGDALECMNAACVLHNAGAFPHPVLAVSVTKTRAYVVDKPGHCVRYVLDDSAGTAIDAHDAEGMAEVGELTLHAPTGQWRKGQTHGTTHTDNGATDRPRTPRSLGAVGARRRELVAVGALLDE